MKVQFYYAAKEYVEFLKQAETRERGFTCVPNIEYQNRNKFVYGAVLNINGMDYFVPVSSKIGKDHEYNIDIKTDDKINPIKGSLRFQYMIPIPHNCLTKLVIDDIPDFNQRAKISKELKFCRRNKDKIEQYAQKTYLAVITQKNDKLLSHSCDFLLLERACLEYCRIHDIPSETEQSTAEVT